MRLYLNGVCVATNLHHALALTKDLDPALSPGVAIGNRSRYDWTQPFSGFMDELPFTPAPSPSRRSPPSPPPAPPAKPTSPSRRPEPGQAAGHRGRRRSASFTGTIRGGPPIRWSSPPSKPTRCSRSKACCRHPDRRHHPERSAAGTLLPAGGAALRSLRARMPSASGRSKSGTTGSVRRPTRPVAGLAANSAWPRAIRRRSSRSATASPTRIRCRLTACSTSSSRCRSGHLGDQHPRICRPGSHLQFAAGHRLLQPDELSFAGGLALIGSAGLERAEGSGYQQSAAARHRPDLLSGRHQSQPGRRSPSVWGSGSTSPRSPIARLTTNVVGPAGIPRYFQFDVPANGTATPQAVASGSPAPTAT